MANSKIYLNFGPVWRAKGKPAYKVTTSCPGCNGDFMSLLAVEDPPMWVGRCEKCDELLWTWIPRNQENN